MFETQTYQKKGAFNFLFFFWGAGEVHPVGLIIINDHDSLSVTPPLLVNVSILNNPTPPGTNHMIHEQPLPSVRKRNLQNA